MSISKWNAKDKEAHYYVYKNSFKVKDACVLLNISQPTWRKAIERLKETLYIYEQDKCYKIFLPNTYVPLDIKLMKCLIDFGVVIDGGGIIISLYSILYRYFNYQQSCYKTCEITISQLARIFGITKTPNYTTRFITMLGVFAQLGLIQFVTHQRNYKGRDYTAYEITQMTLTLPKHLENKYYGPDDIDDIIKSLQTTIKEENKQN